MLTLERCFPRRPKLTKATLTGLLGGSLSRARPLDAEVNEVIPRPGYCCYEVSYTADENERVKAYLLVPSMLKDDKRPGVIVWHQHNGEYSIGRSEPAGFSGNADQHLGVDLVKEGYVVLCPDIIGFEDRQSTDYPGSNLERLLHSTYVMQGRCLAWKYLCDARAALNFLASRPEVEADRLGACGHSLGSTISWLQAATDDRIKVAIGNCCLVTTSALGLVRDGFYHSEGHIIPGIGRYVGDAAAAAALIASSGRKLHLNFGENDPLNPLRAVMDAIEFLKRTQGVGKFTAYIAPGVGHALTAEMKEQVMSHLALGFAVESAPSG